MNSRIKHRPRFEKRHTRSLLLTAFLLCFLWLPLPAARVFAADAPRARVIFIGDIMTHAEQLERPRSTGTWDFSPQFRRVKPLFDDALVVGNLETVFAGGGNFTGYPAFNTPDELALSLAKLILRENAKRLYKNKI